jgi:hypothetical protein
MVKKNSFAGASSEIKDYFLKMGKSEKNGFLRNVFGLKTVSGALL